jgi:hypothetical protein
MADKPTNNPVRPLEDYRLTLARKALAEYYGDNTGLDAERLAHWCGRFSVIVENLIALGERREARS